MIQFTQHAVDKVRDFMTQAEPKMVLRIKIDDKQSQVKGELSYSFALEPFEQGGDKDLNIPAHGFTVRMDARAGIKLANRVVDWESKDGKEGFALKFAVEDPLQNVQDQNKTPADLAVDILKTIFDPEIPVNIYDMGLIYEVNQHNETTMHVLMTLTAPNCPAAESLPSEIQERLQEIPNIETVDVELTWSPAWSPDRMTEAARLDLGI